MKLSDNNYMRVYLSSYYSIAKKYTETKKVNNFDHMQNIYLIAVYQYGNIGSKKLK